MAFMMPVVKNDWDIYNSQRARRTPEGPERAAPGRVRKVSESRSEGPVPGSRVPLSPHRSAPAMRSLSYCRAPASRASLRVESPRKGSASPARPEADKFHSRLVEKLKRALGAGRAERREERRSWANACLCACAGRAPPPPSAARAAPPACPTCDRRPRRHSICDMYPATGAPPPDRCWPGSPPSCMFVSDRSRRLSVLGCVDRAGPAPALDGRRSARWAVQCWYLRMVSVICYCKLMMLIYFSWSLFENILGSVLTWTPYFLTALTSLPILLSNWASKLKCSVSVPLGSWTVDIDVRPWCWVARLGST